MSGPAWPGQEVTQPTATPQPQPAVPGGVFIPNGDNQALDQQQQTTQIASGQTSIADTGHDNALQDRQAEFGNADTLRGRYNSEAPVQAYTTAIPLFTAALHTEPTGAGDLSLITTVAKLSDPTTGVRQGEAESASDASPFFQAKFAQLKGQLDASGGKFSPEFREQLRRELLTRMKELNQAYIIQRQRYEQDATASGVDPIRVVGPHVGEAFTPDIVTHFRNAADQYGADTTNSPEMVGGGPEGDGGGPIGAPPGEALNGWYQNADGSLAPVYGKPGLRVSGEGYIPFDPSAPIPANAPYESRLEAEYQRRLNAGLISAPGLGDKARMGVAGGLLDEASGVGGAISSGLGIRKDTPAEAYQFERDLERLIQEKASARTGNLGTAVELLGNAASLGSGAADVATTQAVPQTTRQLVKEGAVAGAVPGYGYGEGAQDSTTGAVLNASLGGAIGAVAGKFANRPRQTAASGSQSAQNYAAGQRYGLDLSIGDVGGRGSQMFERTLDAQPASASLLNKPREALTNQLETAVGNVADTFGAPASHRELGVAAQDGAKAWIERFDRVSGQAYDAIPIPKEAPADVGATRAALRSLTDTFGSNPALRDATQNATLVRYRQALEKGGLSWGDLKDFRSQIGEQVGEALFTDGTRKSQLKALYGAMSQDMEATARAQGPAALARFKRANDLYADGQKRIEGAVTALLGNDKGATPESAADLINRIARGGKGSSDLATLADIRKTLKPDEWGQVSNGLIRLMGQPVKSEGRDFSPKTFMQVYKDMAPEAKNLLFGGANKALRQNLDDFSKVVERIATNDSTRNVSGSAFGMGNMLTTGFGASIGNSIPIPVVGPLLGVMLGHGSVRAAGRLWTSPGFVRWATGYTKMLAGAARAGKINPAAQASQMASLTRLASANSAIASDAIGLQRQLMAAFDAGPLPLAANSVPQNGDAGTTKTEPGPR